MNDDEARQLGQVAAGTPMGELLRRYWHPIAAVAEFDANPIKPVRLLGEDLVLYRDKSGTYGLIDRHCSHRSADLSYGWVEQCGIRCSYHGWQFDGTGACVAQPYEDVVGTGVRFRQSAGLKGYKVQEMAGMLFAYMGPDPAPLCPNWELFDYENGYRQIVFAEIPCHWLQCAENNLDPVHFEWLHNNWSGVQASGNYGPQHLKIHVDEWEFGFGYRRIMSDTDESHDFWQRSRLHMMPHIFMPSGAHLEYRVPVDEHTTLNVLWHYDPVPHEKRPFVQESIPAWNATINDPETGRWVTSHPTNQDTIAWAGQGPLTDRTREHLGRSDVGIVKMRRQLFKDMERVARGEDPMGVVRDPDKYRVIRWPHDLPEQISKGWSIEEWKAIWLKRHALASRSRDPADAFPLYAGQPVEVRDEFLEAMGLTLDDLVGA